LTFTESQTGFGDTGARRNPDRRPRPENEHSGLEEVISMIDIYIVTKNMFR
jgi:hypothetical protein